jgi:hypothetical protein
MISFVSIYFSVKCQAAIPAIPPLFEGKEWISIKFKAALLKHTDKSIDVNFKLDNLISLSRYNKYDHEMQHSGITKAESPIN